MQESGFDVGYFSGFLSTLDVEEGFLLFVPRSHGVSGLSGQLVLGNHYATC